MKRYVAFLGGLNVGGHRVTGPDLVAEFTRLGFTDVATFLASGKLQVAMLLEPPDASAQATVRKLSSDEDKLAIDATELYWLPSGGISESDLDLKTLSAALGPSTMRTVNTVRRIAAKFLSGGAGPPRVSRNQDPRSLG